MSNEGSAPITLEEALARVSPPIYAVLQHFQYGHHREEMQATFKHFADLAVLIAITSSNPETTVALRKLLEAKDATARAVYAWKDRPAPLPTPS